MTTRMIVKLVSSCFLYFPSSGDNSSGVGVAMTMTVVVTVTVLVSVTVSVTVGTGDGDGDGGGGGGDEGEGVVVSGTQEKATAALLPVLGVPPRGVGQFDATHMEPLGQDASSQLRGARQETVRSSDDPLSSHTSPSGQVELVHTGEHAVTLLLLLRLPDVPGVPVPCRRPRPLLPLTTHSDPAGHVMSSHESLLPTH